MPIRTELPTRVVYVGTDGGQDPPRLYSSNGKIAGYVALSYCWGGSQRHQTERNRIEGYMDALPWEELPKSIQDAIILTRALGIRYIWIDSLCIMQDCDEDKHREMARMINIYKNAILTISAARAKSCDEGFLGVQDKRVSLLQTSIKLPMACLNGAVGSVLLYPFRSLFQSGDIPIDKRAWTYQEKTLSRRVVSFFNDAIEWNCATYHLSDDRLGINELSAKDAAYQKLVLPGRKRTNWMSMLLYSTSEYLQILPVIPALLWPLTVYEYTLGSLSNLDDRLPAIAGIASECQRLTGDVYIAGLWMPYLIQGLQWRAYARSKESSNDTGNRDFKYYAPTWSWASVDGCIIKIPMEQHDLDSDRVEIIYCKIIQVSISAPLGAVNGGELEIRAPLKFLSDREVKEMLAQRFSDSKSIGVLFLDQRSQLHADELTTLHGGAAQLIEPTGVWFLGLSKHVDLTYEYSGLALAKRGDGLFERIGVFQMYVGEDWLEYGTTERNELRSSWGDDYVITTVTIV